MKDWVSDSAQQQMPGNVFPAKLANISHREKVLLGYTLDSLSNHSSRRNSEVDFSDVFGGPPRRSSIQEGHDSLDSVDEEAEGSRSSWLGSGQKPVFGDEMGTRRRYPSEDFFDDIFRGDRPSSCSHSPRRRDPISSATGSRIMSPVHPSPPMVEPLPSPAMFSLPARLTTGDFPASKPLYHYSNLSMTRFSQSMQSHDVIHADIRLSYRPSPLSYQKMVDGKQPASKRMLEGNIGEPGLLSKDSKSSEVPTYNSQFHFSMYKWACKGVPIVMSLRKRNPSRSKEITKHKRILSVTNMVQTEIMGIHEVDTPANDSPSFNRRESSSPSRVVDSKRSSNTVFGAKIEECQSSDEISPVAPTSVSYSRIRNVKGQNFDEAISYDLKDQTEVSTLLNKKSGADIDDNSTKSQEDTKKLNTRPLRSFFQEKEKGNEKISAAEKSKESMAEGKETPSVDDVNSSRKINKIKVPKSFRKSKNDHHKNEDAGKVKELANALNQESTTKTKRSVLGQSQSPRWNESTTIDTYMKVKSTLSKIHDKKRASKINQKETLLEASELVDNDYFLPGKQHFDVNNLGSVLDTPSPGSSKDGLRDSASNINPTPEPDISAKILLQDVNFPLEDQYHEDTQACECKIRLWSKGKEGNIRALLSTLQYVLWQNSGWKPVPLVDIIEANAVKRAYQKALLCLHPDKLQQKCATSHQKLIAQRVFDILQDAWDHFNSLGNL